MTQKELSYMEDAIKHEENMAAIIEKSIEMLEDEDLVSFMQDELKNHKKLHKELMTLMEEKANEW